MPWRGRRAAVVASTRRIDPVWLCGAFCSLSIAGVGHLVLAVAVLETDPYESTLFPPCAFREWTGVPCPACGATRAFSSLVHGDLAGVLSSNPLLIVFEACVVLCVIGTFAVGCDREKLGEALLNLSGAVLMVGVAARYLSLAALAALAA